MKLLTFLLTTGLVLSLVLTGFAEEKKLPEKVDVTIVIPPSARMMIGGLSKTVDSKLLASKITDTSSTAYGFTTGVSKEKGSYQLGVLMADLETSIRAGDKDKSIKACDSLIKGLGKLGASMPLITAVINLNAAVNSGVDLGAINKGALPVVKPFIEDLIHSQGNMAYLRFGEWVESTKLALQVGQEKDMKLASEFVKEVNMSEYFLTVFKGKDLPKGIFKSLEKMEALGDKQQELTQDDIKSALDEINNIAVIMS
jgi:hypothetical protein